MLRMLIVGQAPALRHGRAQAFDSGPSAVRLRRLLGLQPADALHHYVTTVNLVAKFPGRNEDAAGDAWGEEEQREAKLAAEALEPTLKQFDVVVLCGRRVAKAFGLGNAQFMDAQDGLGTRIVVIPHPSGLCRFWNDRAAMATARTVIAAAAGAGGDLFDRSMFAGGE